MQSNRMVQIEELLKSKLSSDDWKKFTDEMELAADWLSYRLSPEDFQTYCRLCNDSVEPPPPPVKETVMLPTVEAQAKRARQLIKHLPLPIVQVITQGVTHPSGNVCRGGNHWLSDGELASLLPLA
jgi:hypothetical protein